MRNHQLGRLGANVAFSSIFLFALFMLLPDKVISVSLSSAASLFISLGYLVMTCALASLADNESKGSALAALAIAAIYATLICFVYFTQITTVWQKAAPEQMLQALVYQPGTWMFNIDMLGYAMLGLSTFFAGLVIKPQGKQDLWLRRLLMIHGIFFIMCLIMPVLGVFTQTSGAGGDLFGILVLEFWCLYFLPVTWLFGGYMKRLGGMKAAGV